MHYRNAWLAALVALAPPLASAQDDFTREGPREVRDALEGKPAPALQVQQWQNTSGQAIDLADLHGKVVVLDFWGTW